MSHPVVVPHQSVSGNCQSPLEQGQFVKSELGLFFSIDLLVNSPETSINHLLGLVNQTNLFSPKPFFPNKNRVFISMAIKEDCFQQFT